MITDRGEEKRLIIPTGSTVSLAIERQRAVGEGNICGRKLAFLRLLQVFLTRCVYKPFFKLQVASAIQQCILYIHICKHNACHEVTMLLRTLQD